MKTLRFLAAAVGVAALLLTTGCGDGGGLGERKPKADAIAVMVPTQGNETAGVVEFVRTDGGLRVMATLAKLPPGEHGFHIHQYGDCSSGDAGSAGGHFNPGNTPHGAPDAAERHAGDLGNIVADEQGNASLDHVFSGIALEGDTSIIGRSVIVHAGADDFTTQPTGAAGKRLACGVVGIAGH